MWALIDKQRAVAALPVLEANPEMAYIAECLKEAIEAEVDPVNVFFRDAAKEIYTGEGALEFDDDAVVSRGSSPGAYVMGWRWLDNSQLGLGDHEDLPSEDLTEEHLPSSAKT